jgi:hypothetical protein
MTWDGMSPTFRPPSHDLACEPDEAQRDLTDRTPYARTSQPPPCLRCAVYDELQRYREFKHGWDGYSAHMFSHDIVIKATRIVSAIYSALDGSVSISPGPCPDASIQLEIQAGDLSATITIDENMPEGGLEEALEDERAEVRERFDDIVAARRSARAANERVKQLEAENRSLREALESLQRSSTFDHQMRHRLGS